MTPNSIGISAISYTGTTLLSMILGSHPDCLSIGHYYLLFEPYRSRTKRGTCEICELLEKDCPVKPQRYKDFDKTVIDSSSTMAWFKKSKPGRIVWMFRDPVSLASSYVKNGSTIEYMCKHYQNYLKAKDLVIDYENITKETLELKFLFYKLGLQFDADYLKYWNYDNHMIGGNRAVLVEIARHKKPEKLLEIIKEVSRGRPEYEKRYREGFKPQPDILTSKQKKYVLDKCGKVYDRLKKIESRLITWNG